MKHDFPFDPTYGYDLAALQRVGAPPAPADFETFWRDTYEQTRAVRPNVARRRVDSPRRGVDVYEVEFDSLGGFRVGAWLTVPSDNRVERGVVVGHGYGRREGPDFDLPGPPAAAIFPCARGFTRSARPDISEMVPRHVLHGIEGRDTYIHRFCVADLWAAVSALLEFAPAVADRIHYAGSSFAGGLGAMALPWDARIKRAFLDVPSFGNHPLRVTMPCVGSGDAVRRRYAKHPGVLDVLRYFDSATASTFSRTPTFVAAALFDPAVPPPGQFAVHNALAGEKRLFVREAAHFEWDGKAAEDGRLRRELEQWFAQP